MPTGIDSAKSAKCMWINGHTS